MQMINFFSPNLYNRFPNLIVICKYFVLISVFLRLETYFVQVHFYLSGQLL